MELGSQVINLLTTYVLEDPLARVFTMQRMLGVTRASTDRIITYCEEQVTRIGLLNIVYSSDMSMRIGREVFTMANIVMSQFHCADIVSEICGKIIGVYNTEKSGLDRYAKCVNHKYIIYMRWLSYRKLHARNSSLEINVTRLNNCNICDSTIGVVDYSYYDENIDKHITYRNCCKEGCTMQCNSCGFDIIDILQKPIVRIKDEYDVVYDWALEINCTNCGSQGEYNMKSVDDDGNDVVASDVDYVNSINDCTMCGLTNDIIDKSYVDVNTNKLMLFPRCCVGGCTIRCDGCNKSNTNVKLRPVIDSYYLGSVECGWTYRFNCVFCHKKVKYDLHRQRYVVESDSGFDYTADPYRTIESKICSICNRDWYTTGYSEYVINNKICKFPSVCINGCKVKCGTCGAINIGVRTCEYLSSITDDTIDSIDINVTTEIYKWVYKTNCGKCNTTLCNLDMVNFDMGYDVSTYLHSDDESTDEE